MKKVFTDCANAKFDAVRGVFAAREMFDITTISNVTPQIAPTNIPDLFKHGKQRLLDLVRKVNDIENENELYFATILKGFFEDGANWYLIALALMLGPEGRIVPVHSISIPFPPDVSEEMYKNPMNRYAALKRKFPSWDKDKTPIVELFGVNEKEWYQVPLRTALMQVLNKTY